MKKLLVCLVVVFLSLVLLGYVSADNYLDEYTQLLTDYVWALDDGYWMYQGTQNKNAEPNFKDLKSIQLPDERILFTGDESGRMFLTFVKGPADYAVTGRTYVADVSFNNTKDVMVLRIESYIVTGFFKYVRQ